MSWQEPDSHRCEECGSIDHRTRRCPQTSEPRENFEEPLDPEEARQNVIDAGGL